jgi:hypothetical protein
MSSLYNDLRKRNNAAAELIECGFFAQAYEELKGILRSTVDVVREAKYDPLPLYPVPLEVTLHSEENDQEDNTGFHWPFLVPQSSTDQGEFDQMSALCAVALFNMGLACHKSVYTTPNSSKHDKILVRAKHIYLQALQMGEIFPNRIFVLALQANLLNISFELGQLDDTKYWRHQVAMEMKSLPPGTPETLTQVFGVMQVYYTDGLVAARAA